MVALDTHVAVWLLQGDLARFSKKALKALDTAPLSISPLVRLELQYLNEIGRVLISAKRLCETLERDYGVTYSELPTLELVLAGEREDWTRDPFDRLIVADARARGVQLISYDSQIAERYHRTLR